MKPPQKYRSEVGSILIVRLFDGNFPPSPFAEGEAFPDFPVGIWGKLTH